MDEGVSIRVWDDRDERWARKFRVTLPDGTERPAGQRLADLQERAVDGMVVLPRPFGEGEMRVPVDLFDGDPEHTLLAIGFHSTERREPPPGAKAWRPPPPPADLQALLDELHRLQARYRETGGEALVPEIEAQWERVEAHPAHTGWRERPADYVEVAPGIRVWDTRRS